MKNNESTRLAAHIMAMEVVSELLVSTVPGQLGQKLTEQLRELTGAHGVLLLAHSDNPVAHELMGVCPPRCAALFPAGELDLFCPVRTPEALPVRTEELPPEHPLRAPLSRAEVESLLRFPLHAAGELVGSLLFFDLPEMERMDEVAKTLKPLLPAIAVALKNAFAHQRIEKQARELELLARELERRVAQRTTELEAANKMLAASRLAALNIMEDAIAARQRTEEYADALRQSARMHQIILDCMPCVALLLRPGSREIVAMNETASRAGATLGKTCFGSWPQCAQPCSFCLAPEAWATGQAQHIVVEAGVVVWEAHWVPVSADLYMHYAFDITDRKRAEEEKQQLQAQLAQAQKMESVGRLAGGVAHDFNNMLGVILGHAEMALDQVDSASPLHDDLEQIRLAANRSADLTRQLLAFARKQAVSPKVLDLNETIPGILKMLRRLIGENIALQWQPGPDLWPVKMDPSQVDQILANLAVNARDAIAGVGTLTIATENVALDKFYFTTPPESAPGDYIMLAVGDTGGGMDRETLEHIFEPFFTTKGVGKGTGLGLATVYGAVKQNHGFIDVTSEPGRGSTFRIYLPRAESAGPIAAEGLTPAAHGSETVLLVEDEEAILKLGRAILEKHGYAVLAARSPAEALILAERHEGPIDLLITDVVMPEMNGKDLKTRIVGLRPGIKALFMSGYTSDIIAHDGVIEAGVEFLQKPFSVTALAQKVREVLKG